MDSPSTQAADSASHHWLRFAVLLVAWITICVGVLSQMGDRSAPTTDAERRALALATDTFPIACLSGAAVASAIVLALDVANEFAAERLASTARSIRIFVALATGLTASYFLYYVIKY